MMNHVMSPKFNLPDNVQHAEELNSKCVCHLCRLITPTQRNKYECNNLKSGIFKPCSWYVPSQMTPDYTIQSKNNASKMLASIRQM
jgi:hypothetical protein